MDRPELEARSQTFALAVIALCETVRAHPNWRQQSDQLVDAASSVGANYRASGRARSRAEFVAKLGTVNEEIDEAVYWLELMVRGRAAAPARLEPLLSESKELRAIFAASYGTARRRKGGK
jgi:four helix bundle protein